MEFMCGVYYSKLDYTADPEKGELTIKKGNVLYVPDLCWHKQRVVALQYTPRDVGFVNRNCLNESAAADGKKMLGMVCISFRA